MRIVRYQTRNDPPRWGWVSEDRVGPIEGSPITGDFRRMETEYDLARVKLLAPLEPSKIICVGRNYVAHAKEHGVDVPEYPLLFFKPPSSVIGPGGVIHLPPQSEQVEHEGELAVIIGRTVRRASAEQAQQCVLGYTIANDVTARDLQRRDGQWTRAKGFDTFCPIGPWFETYFDPADAVLTTSVNGEMRQMASTRDMVFSVGQLIAFASSIMTLVPGDVILTGTPAGVSPLHAGDVVEVSIEGLGTLRNPVALEPER